MQGVRRSVRCTAMRFHSGIAAGVRRVQNARGQACRIAAVCGWGAHVRAQRQSGSDARGGSCLWRMCAPQGVPCKRADGREVRKASSGSTQPSRRSAPCYVLCCRAARIRSPPTSREAVGKLLCSATQHGAGCGVQVVKGVGSRGRWSWMRWSRERCGCRLRCSASPSGTCGGGAWPWLWAAHPREAMEERAPSAR